MPVGQFYEQARDNTNPFPRFRRREKIRTPTGELIMIAPNVYAVKQPAEQSPKSPQETNNETTTQKRTNR